MARFTDTLGREWEVVFDLSLARRIKKDFKIDLLAIDQGKTIERLATDLETLVNVLYVACEGQCQTDGVSDDDFGRGLAGDVFASAAQALIEALADFFPPDRRALLLKTWEKVNEFRAAAVEVSLQKMDGEKIQEAQRKTLERVGVEIDREIDRQLSGPRSGRPLPLSALTPAP